MGIFEEMAKRSPEIEKMKITVLPGDDINKAVWRFEKEIIEAPLETSANWDTMARRLRVFDPFQIADSSNPLLSYTQSVPAEWIYPSSATVYDLLHREGDIIKYEHQYKQNPESDWLTYKEGLIDTRRLTTETLDSDYMRLRIEAIDEYVMRITTEEIYETNLCRAIFSVERILQPRRRFNIPTNEEEFSTAILTVSDLDWRS